LGKLDIASTMCWSSLSVMSPTGFNRTLMSLSRSFTDRLSRRAKSSTLRGHSNCTIEGRSRPALRSLSSVAARGRVSPRSVRSTVHRERPVRRAICPTAPSFRPIVLQNQCYKMAPPRKGQTEMLTSLALYCNISQEHTRLDIWANAAMICVALRAGIMLHNGGARDAANH